MPLDACASTEAAADVASAANCYMQAALREPRSSAAVCGILRLHQRWIGTPQADGAAWAELVAALSAKVAATQSAGAARRCVDALMARRVAQPAQSSSLPGLLPRSQPSSQSQPSPPPRPPPPPQVSPPAPTRRQRPSRDPPPPEPVEAAPRPVRASYDDVRKSRGKRRNGMDFACHVLSDNLKMRKLDVAVHLLDPFVMMELSALAEVKTPKGQLEVFLELSRGSLTNKCCQRMWASLKDPAFWDHGDFARDGSVPSLKRKADCAVADVVFDVLTTATCHFFLWEQEFTHGLPNYFHFLVSPVEQERVEAPPFAGFLLPPEIFGKNISMDFISPKNIVFASQNRIKNKWLKFIS